MVDEPKRLRARKPKTRSGCSVCKGRKVKCDEEVPSCQRCIKIGVECPGYYKPVKWSVKHEKNIVNLPQASESSFAWFDSRARRLSNLIQPKSDFNSPEAQLNNNCEVSATSRFCQGSVGSSSSMHKSPDVLQDIPETELLVLSTGAAPASYEDSQVDEEFLLEPCPPPDDYLSLTSYSPTPQLSLILDHYFLSVCRFNSSFDSSCNPFRTEVSRLMADSPVLFGCVLSMSAAHLYHGDNGSSYIPLQFQTEAISRLSEKLSQMTTVLPSCSVSESEAEIPVTALVAREKTKAMQVPDDLVLSIIFLGMSAKRSKMTRIQTFIVSSMIYWEAMCSPLFDQEYEGLSHLNIFCDPHPASLIQPCPWTGVATPVFIFLAKTLTLVHNNRTLSSLRIFETSEIHRRALYLELLAKATHLEHEIVGYRLPFVGFIDDIGDPCTTPAHFLAISRCYRLAALLELYRAFPETIRGQTNLGQAVDIYPKKHGDKANLTLDLAFSLLEVLEKIPSNSGTISIQLLSLLIAGSALGPATSKDPQHETPRQLEVKRFRNFVRARIRNMYTVVNLGPIGNAMLILKEVWSRMDVLPLLEENSTSAPRVHWIDVMSEKRLESIFG
ncbi:Arginine metabolism regulation II [Fusarium mundagurra]|uniref:Arginine metabolism regulation II n=1 Tax=Fusarium mundagurra TaxID=1567541 RepID=A0A8H6DBG9_9HYPO|nr:Arginine metabolism regulation II [Fusarium mundagurra]